MKAKKGDVVIAIIAVLAGICILAYPIGNVGAKVNIYVDGHLYESDSINTKKTININTKFGNNTVVIDKHGVCVKESNCKDKLEVKQGYINKAGQSLICLPNRLIIRIEGNGDLDAVTY